MENVKAKVIVAVSALMSWLGILAIPVLLLVGCNIVDYMTGICAAGYREEPVSSYKGIRGIYKKVGMWLLVLVGAWVDILINYGIECAGFDFALPFIVAIVVAVWLVVNEIISILENLQDIGVKIPPFLLPLMKNIKKKVEDKAQVLESKEDMDYESEGN
ncbi:MAG: phage holin family protein [Lachnospiraceae bacterium]|nr:phage holin family protein [Lachnospiraceae bacterium]